MNARARFVAESFLTPVCIPISTAPSLEDGSANARVSRLLVRLICHGPGEWIIKEINLQFTDRIALLRARRLMTRCTVHGVPMDLKTVLLSAL